MPFDSPGYATYVPGRHPEFKAHAHRGLAKSALKYKMHRKSYDYGEYDTIFPAMALYKMCAGEDGDLTWVLDTEITKGSVPSDYPELWPNG
jgi:hypothetical protein